MNSDLIRARTTRPSSRSGRMTGEFDSLYSPASFPPITEEELRDYPGTDSSALQALARNSGKEEAPEPSACAWPACTCAELCQHASEVEL